MTTRLIYTIALFLCLLSSISVAADELSLEQIMADTDWIGNGPEEPYWADDGRSIYYFRKVVGEERRELFEIDLNGRRLRTVSDEEKGRIDVPQGDWTRDRSRKTYAREGDIYVKNVRTGAIQQLTRTHAAESAPVFLRDENKVAFRRGDAILVRDLRTGLEYQPAEVRAQKDPDAEDDKYDFLKDQQQRLFETIHKQKERREQARERARAEQKADPTRPDLPWYIGEDYEIDAMHLGPREDWLIVVARNKKQTKPAKPAVMPNYVTESGYVATREVRSLVGTGEPASDEVLLLDLKAHELHTIDLTVLPGIFDDPLKELREAAEARRKKAEETEKEAGEEKPDAPKREEKPKARSVAVATVRWSDDGRDAVVQFRSRDNKDRWLARLDLVERRLAPLYREMDEAWVNARSFAGLEWLPDNEWSIFISEETGYAHLYVMNVRDGAKRALTSGQYEVSSPTLCRDGDHVYFRANMDHPGVYEVYRVAIRTGAVEQLTRLGGNNQFELAPNDRHILVIHSETTRPSEIYVQNATPGARARRLTHTISDEFQGIDWIKPEIVEVPSSHGDRPIYARLYRPSGESSAKRPAVVFIHGAGYLQNAHQGWSTYEREFMFHTFLARHGYVVLDMDYRASAGYGRDWRAAVYRRMGAPEVEDLEDGVRYLVERHNVDPARVGCYGGSYGGFLTLMALFTRPELFACGAALRPVTDWAQYNHAYTSNILNIPLVDPEAYEISSPIEFAEGLSKPLLICHGMQDDNVFYADSVRLVQRLIELKKENWEFATYPVEPHGFREASSWLDEYRRIFKLFETWLK